VTPSEIATASQQPLSDSSLPVVVPAEVEVAQGRATWSWYSPAQRWGFLAVLFLVTTSNYFDYYVISVLLEPIKAEYNVSDAALGALSGFSFALCYALGALPIARWADHGNRRTIIAVSLTAWSLMTAACGMARSFWHLVVARLGVGAVEPGAAPPSQSLVVEYFPPEMRATAISILTMGGSATGWLVGVGVGGYVAAKYGWRMAFLVAGLPGLLLALAVWRLLPEPRERTGLSARARNAEGLGEALAKLRRKRSFLFALAGISVYAICAYGSSIFLPSFMIRSLHVSLMQVSVTWGITVAAANFLGAFSGGWTADYLGRRDIRWYGWVPAISLFLGALGYWCALATQDFISFVIVDFFAEFVLAVGVPVCFAAVHTVCGSARRASAIALVHFSFMLVGSGIGPVVAGAVSDGLNAAYGQESLRLALIVMQTFILPAALLLYWTGRLLPRDREE
jgi:MFS family permease